MRIYLVGYMGVGKTTVGKKLARMLDLPFYDLDAVITESVERTIPEIFEAEGESGFRGVERSYLHKITDTHPSMVLSTGGGTPCFYDNMQFMNEQGITIYLQMDVASLSHRLINSKANRPLIANITAEGLQAYVKRHLDERKDYYEDAHITFPALGMGPAKYDRLVQEVRALRAGGLNG